MQNSTVGYSSLMIDLLCTVSKTHAYQNFSKICQAVQNLVTEEVNLSFIESDVSIQVGHVDSRLVEAAAIKHSLVKVKP